MPFAQQVDVRRPHTLLTQDPKHNGQLEFRYDDTLETVTVPNVWYNQTFQVRVAAVLWHAQQEDERAAQYEKSPPYGVTPAAAADIARRYRERAARIRAEAARMQAAGDPLYPVAASLLELDYGPNVT